MASKAAAILLSLNLLFFTCVQCSTPPLTCPKETIKFSVCAALLGFLGNVQLGTPCCSLIQGLADLEASVCLCTALKANVLGINLNIPISLSLVLNHCGKNVPKEFVCS